MVNNVLEQDVRSIESIEDRWHIVLEVCQNMGDRWQIIS